VESLSELDSDPGMMRFLNGGTPTWRYVIQNDILPLFCSYHKQLPGCGFWVAMEKATGDFLGWFSFRPWDAVPHEVNPGFRLSGPAPIQPPEAQPAGDKKRL
jgi:hypothetical protein